MERIQTNTFLEWVYTGAGDQLQTSNHMRPEVSIIYLSNLLVIDVKIKGKINTVFIS